MDTISKAEGIRSNSLSAVDPNRNHFIDITRGLLIYWMLVAHAITITGIGKESYLYYLRPAGWASHGFVMLSGFSLAVVLMGRGMSGAALRHRLSRRAWQLLGWALVTELLSRFLKDALLSPDRSLSLRILFDPARVWTLSAYLIPTSVLFGIAALVAPYFRQPSLVRVIGLSLIATVLISEGIAIPKISPLPYSGVFGIPVIVLVCLAFFGVGIGLVFKRVSLPVFLAWLVPMGILLLMLQHLFSISATFYYVGTFFITLCSGGVLKTIPRIGFIQSMLARMGRSAMLLFIAHRFIFQIIRWFVGYRLQGQSLFIFLLLFTLFLLVSISVIKERTPKFKMALRRVGL